MDTTKTKQLSSTKLSHNAFLSDHFKLLRDTSLKPYLFLPNTIIPLNGIA